jgi:hypothetical protein
MSKKLRIHTGQEYAGLTILKEVDPLVTPGGQKFRQCLIRCSCGELFKTQAHHLRSGNTSSCGCKRREALLLSNTKHGERHTRIYRIWCNMKSRCTNPNIRSYKNYGANGIDVCKRWESFDLFFEDMNKGYREDLSIDRINPFLGYSKENCRWATPKEQANNKRSNFKPNTNG